MIVPGFLRKHVHCLDEDMLPIGPIQDVLKQ